MKLTNNFNLPKVLVNAIKGFNREYASERSFEADEISVTELYNPYIKVMKQRYSQEITEDVSETLSRMMGSAVHIVLEHSADEDALVEERIHYPITVEGQKFNLTGKADIYEATEILSDYKTGKVYGAKRPVKPEHIAQLNVLKLLYEEAGFNVSSLKIMMVLLDWNKKQAKASKEKGGDYPEIPFVEKDVEIWSKDKTLEYIKKQIKAYKDMLMLADKALTSCNDSQRWKKETQYKVVKVGGKTAVKGGNFYEDKAGAENLLKTKGEGYELFVTEGEDTRCLDWCNLIEHCSYYKLNHKK